MTAKMETFIFHAGILNVKANIMKTTFRSILLIIILTSLSITGISQHSSELYNAIMKMDSLYFSAQIECDLEKYASFLSDDFEFFHDNGGFTASKDDEMKGMVIFCGEEQRVRQTLRRELIDGTLKVYPMDNYGALEFCDHVFYLQINDGTEKVVSSGKMTALWKLINNDWKLTRIISYHHQPLAEIELSYETLNQYVGDYVLPDRIVNIVREGKLLRATDITNGKPEWNSELFPESENTFYFNYENVVYEFVKKGSTVTTLNIYENGELIEKAKRK
ncbi:nuclear transport factor 2 family protein [Aquiflexum sp.]|uniref:nuclear transport factor 2 family protein n=1 Tax=Aquiflexum sp. TaxID=1872584 RepID=UPI003593299F